MAGTCSTLCLIIVTLFIPPLGVFLISGCGVDFWINVCLTILGDGGLVANHYFHVDISPAMCTPSTLEYVYYQRKKLDPMAHATERRAPGVYSDRIQNGGHPNRNYGTV
ncbi:Proteolipid membrane potential modulator [Penicillium chermesinum]|nr:Proteolipid membrane potential modulator [Penicillium chermesinum]